MENHQYNTRKRKKNLLNDQNDAKDEDLTQTERMSQDLFSDNITLSQETTPSQRAEQKRLEKQITDFTWVQCDGIDCQKWRRLPVSECEGLSQKQWYCHMGTDSRYNSCGAPEEDHRAYDKLARKLGLNYVMSQLAEGTLVWAKMMGYCRWPALITRDPACGMSCEWDIDGEPQVYHVEYLGTKHSHGWIRVDKLTLYGHKEEDKTTQKRKCRTKQTVRTMAAHKIERRKYNRVPVDLAMMEADELLHVNEDQRLAKCTFKYSKKVEDRQTESLIRATNGIKRRSKKDPQQSCCQLCGWETESKKKSIGQSKTDRSRAALLQQVDAVVPNCQTGLSLDTDNDTHSQSDVFQFENLKFKSTLVDKSKEEKFKIDVEMYKRNEKAFDHDLRRFMDRNNVVIRKIPVWQRVPIGLFQIFMSVFERGGYKKVCMSRSWAAVYKELTELPVGHPSVGGIAKNYYERNVYPYELYITGGDYQAALDNIRNKKNKKPGKVSASTTIPDVPESDKHSSEHTTVDGNGEMELGELEEEEDVDLEAMLTQLEAYSKMCQLEDDVDAAQKRLGIDITYHDDSSGSMFSPGVKLADTASEFGLSHLPDEDAQMVPSQPGVDMDSDLDNPSHSDQILQELHVLDDEFQQWEQEMNSFL